MEDFTIDFILPVKFTSGNSILVISFAFIVKERCDGLMLAFAAHTRSW
jgi:hypothetical protein